MKKTIEKMKATNLARITLAGAVLLILVHSMGVAHGFYEACYHYIGTYPDEVGESWTRECQGLAHDAGHWFISLNNAAGAGVLPHPQIWKVPVTQDLGSLTGDTSGILKGFLSSWPQLSGYDHYGDLDYYKYQGTGYLIIPVTAPDPLLNVLVVFRADNLSYVGHTTLVSSVLAYWAAVDRSSPEGFVYLPWDFGGYHGVVKCSLSWHGLHTTGACTLDYLEYYPVLGESGQHLYLIRQQGGEFMPSGELFYMVTGICNPNDDDNHPDDEGIHVIDTRTWRRIKHSTRGSGAFNLDYDPYGISSEEPEGITIWDLDGAGAPGISGQVHVLVLDNDAWDYDDVYIKHYRGYKDIYVNFFSPWPWQYGTALYPFWTVSAANNEAWNGAVIHIQSTCYPEAVTFSKRLDIIAEGGTVVIGACSR